MLTSGLGNPLFPMKEPSGHFSNEWNPYSIHCPGLLRNPQVYENGIIKDNNFDIWLSVQHWHQGVKFELLKPGNSKPYANILKKFESGAPGEYCLMRRPKVKNLMILALWYQQLRFVEPDVPITIFPSHSNGSAQHTAWKVVNMV